jgi:aminopeptidase N
MKKRKVVKEDNKLKDLSLNQIMNTWMKQMGHPVVTITRVDDRTITLSQNHFLLDPTSKSIVNSPYE